MSRMQNMYSFDFENGAEVEENFFTALSLLHSTDNHSADKLRRILDKLITKKYGQSKTLAVRRTRRDFCPPLPTEADNCFGEGQEIAQLVNESAESHVEEFTMDGEFLTNGQEIANVFLNDDRMEIPTISIPDEGSSPGDGALCKICNGPRLGPLILLECQECQDVYHSLCHLPPVLDLDIYDPRLVWHCAKCAKLSEAAAIEAAAGLEDQKFRAENLEIPKNLGIRLTDDKKIINDSMEQQNFFRRTKSRIIGSRQDITISDQFQLRNRTSIGRRSAKRQTRTMEHVFTVRNGSSKDTETSISSSGTSSSGLNLRKRIGSKLTVTRGIAK